MRIETPLSHSLRRHPLFEWNLQIGSRSEDPKTIISMAIKSFEPDFSPISIVRHQRKNGIIWKVGEDLDLIQVSEHELSFNIRILFADNSNFESYTKYSSSPFAPVPIEVIFDREVGSQMITVLSDYEIWYREVEGYPCPEYALMLNQCFKRMLDKFGIGSDDVDLAVDTKLPMRQEGFLIEQFETYRAFRSKQRSLVMELKTVIDGKEDDSAIKKKLNAFL